MRTPLAWKNLTGNPRRLILGAAGVSFAAVLMFMQNGFQGALLESPVQIVDLFAGDLFATSSTRYALAAEKRFPARLLTQARADADVAAAEPVMIERATALIRVRGHRQRSIRVIGVEPEPNLFRDPQLREVVSRMHSVGTAIVDVRSKPQYGFDIADPAALASQQIELMDRRLRITGTMELGTDFAHDGNLLVSRQTLARYFPFRGQGKPESVVDFGLIRLRPGVDPVAAAQRLTALAPEQWRVVPRQRLIQAEMDFWDSKTPIGKIFNVGVLMGFAVGVIICYQILYTNIQDSLPELATLKAMGYTGGFFVSLVVRQAIYLSVIGFLPSVLISWALFGVLQSWAGLPIFVTLPRVTTVFLLTLVMCIVSGLLALRKLLQADPASLF
ncbi:ABC transporter permease DevC [Planctomycetaceae bacterium SH139]